MSYAPPVPRPGLAAQIKSQVYSTCRGFLIDLPATPGLQVKWLRERMLSRASSWKIVLGILADAHIYLCLQVACQYTNRSIADVEDLAQEGYFGLLVAEEKYDPTRGSFEGYARLWIRHVIRRALQDNWNRVRLPNHCYGKFARYVREEKRLQQETDVIDESIQLRVQDITLIFEDLGCPVG